MKRLLMSLLLAAPLGAHFTLASRSNPLLTAAPIADAFSGVVEERIDVGSYLYLKVRVASRDSRWVATLRATAPAAAPHVSVHVFARSASFESPRAGRTFSPLSFGSVTPVTE